MKADPVALEEIVRAAARAPSGDNTQPWSFTVGAGKPGGDSTIEIRLDPSRDPSPMNAGQRMARIALGAALENLVLEARARGLDARATVEVSEGVRAVVGFGQREPRPSDEHASAAAAIPTRVTNRRLYDGKPLDPEALDRLVRATAARGESTGTEWVTDRSTIAALADLAGRADAALFGEQSLRQAFLKSVRFDRGAREEVEEGMPVGALELSWIERAALPWMGRAPSWALALAGSVRLYAAHVRRLVASASGLCVVTAGDSRPQTDIGAGRAVERAWLALAREGLAAQPMMSLLVLENIADHGLAPTLSKGLRAKLPTFREELRRLLPVPSGSRPAFLLRFGHAPAPTARTGRRDFHKGSTVQIL